MASVRRQIASASTTISENIEELADNRKLMSKNVIKELRDLTEGVIVRAHTKSDDTTYDHGAIKAGASWIGSSGKKFNFLHRFHKLLQQSESRSTFDGDVSERLMLKYYTYLLRIRALLGDEAPKTTRCRVDDDKPNRPTDQKSASGTR